MFINNKTILYIEKGDVMNNLKSSSELIKSMYRAFSERNLQKLNQICHEEIIWSQMKGFPGGRISLGVNNIISNVYEANSKRWKGFKFEIDEMINSGDSVFVLGNYYIEKINSSELEKIKTTHHFRIENGKITSFQQYTDTKLLWDNLIL